jgi:acetylornithine/N-succinyldiaminopimelate aminotransferase
MTSLKHELAGLSGVKEIRGQGLMIGVELTVPCTELVKLAMTQGVLLNVTGDTVVRLLPPLIFSREQAEILVSTLVSLIKTLLSEQ